MIKKVSTAILFLFLSSSYCMADDNSDPTVIPIQKGSDPGKGHRPKSLPGHDICDNIDCYWQDGTLYINFAIPEGDATAIIWRTSGVTTYNFSTSEGAAIPCGPDYDITRLEIRTLNATYYNVSENDHDLIF